MNFDLKKPCKGCPFGTNKEAVRHLGEDRAEGIIDSITRMQQSFPCHKTTIHDEDGELVHSKKEQHCAGALILLEKHNQPNQMMRISERLGGGYDRTKLEKDSPVFDEYDEFIEAQA